MLRADIIQIKFEAPIYIVLAKHLHDSRLGTHDRPRA
jgi:hypothetical protein